MMKRLDFQQKERGIMNKICLIIYSFVLSLLMPCLCMAAQEGEGGFSIAKILAIALIVIFAVTSVLMIFFTRHLK